MDKPDELNWELLGKIHDSVIAVTFNMNDTFYHACADCSTISSEELLDLYPLIQRYGFTAIVAYEAVRRGHAPIDATPEFVQAKWWIKGEMERADQYGAFWELRMAEKQPPLGKREREKVSQWIRGNVKMMYSFFVNR